MRSWHKSSRTSSFTSLHDSKKYDEARSGVSFSAFDPVGWEQEQRMVHKNPVLLIPKVQMEE